MTTDSSRCGWGQLDRRKARVGIPDINSRPVVLDWRASLELESKFLATSTLLFLASLSATIYAWKTMPRSMPMPGGWTMSMAWMRMPDQSWWEAAASFMGMWLVMMLAMMLPSVVPMLLRYRRSLRTQGVVHTGGPTSIAAAGYFLVWMFVGVVVYPLGAGLSLAEMRSPMFLHLVPWGTGIILLLAGGIQLSQWKARQLGRCRNPAVCDSGPGTKSAWLHGIRLGVDCSLCCAGFMTVLLVNDVMSLPTMAALTVAIAAERIIPRAQRVARALGVVIVAAGLIVMARAGV